MDIGITEEISKDVVRLERWQGRIMVAGMRENHKISYRSGQH